MAVRENLIKLINIIERRDIPWDENSPGYQMLVNILTDEQIDVCLAFEGTGPISAEKIAANCGKSITETLEILNKLIWIGVVEDTHENGGVEYLMPLWLPGVVENLVLNDELFNSHPEIGKAFKDFTWYPLEMAPMTEPGGAGVCMHAVPVEESIMDGTKTADYDLLSYWLDKYEVISVSDCQCRRIRNQQGEWCGHRIQDSCFYLGDVAEFIIKTGRGRRVTHEEAKQILKDAEGEGLVHQIANTHGTDVCITICNCCGCGCMALKNARLYGLNNFSRNDYVAKVDPEKCAACGLCVDYCQVNAVKLGQSLCMKNPPVEEPPREVTPEEWATGKFLRHDYHTHRDHTVETGSAPCKHTCPAHIAIQAYIRLAAQGKYKDALELIKRENPFPAVCGRVCPHSCENDCTRGALDQAVSIDEIKKFIADCDLNEETRFIPKKKHNYTQKMAVIGSGPAGLSCAYYLAVEGYPVTVFEKENTVGGMLKLGIPSFRLEKDVVDAEIEILRQLGVEFRTGVEVGKDVTIYQLRDDLYHAFFFGIGAQKSRKLNVPGEDAEGVIPGIDFLKSINSGEEVALKGKTLVIGGGNVAIDVARAAVRVCDDTVGMYCLESRADMPALPEEQEEAEEEGISINNGWGPKSILTKDGKVTGVEFMRCLSTIDPVTRRFNPKYDENDTITVPADNVILSIGQAIDWGGLLTGLNIHVNPNQTAQADSWTYQTFERDCFVAGDAYTGPRFAIDAIAAGKEAAISMHRHVQGQHMTYGRDKREYVSLDRDNVVFQDYDNTPRQKVGHTAEHKTFKDTRITFTEEQLKKETARCLGCGISVVDPEACIGCGMCSTHCKFDAIHIVRRENDEPVEFIYNKDFFTKMKPYTLTLEKGRLVRRAKKD